MKRVVEIETSFLPAGEYEFEYWADAKNADKKADRSLLKKKVRFRCREVFVNKDGFRWWLCRSFYSGKIRSYTKQL